MRWAWGLRNFRFPELRDVPRLVRSTGRGSVFHPAGLKGQGNSAWGKAKRRPRILGPNPSRLEACRKRRRLQGKRSCRPSACHHGLAPYPGRRFALPRAGFPHPFGVAGREHSVHEGELAATRTYGVSLSQSATQILFCPRSTLTAAPQRDMDGERTQPPLLQAGRHEQTRNSQSQR
jgi:hypothetical protein